MKKKIIAIASVMLIVSVILAVSLISSQAAGVISIGTAEELQKIGADANYPLNGSYKLTADIDLRGIQWKPIGRAGAPFKGTFDGDGHVITGLTIGSASASVDIRNLYCSDGTNKAGDFAGMFAYAQSAVFKNFALKDVGIYIKTGNRNVGGIVGGLDNDTTLGRTHFENVAILSGTVSYQSEDSSSVRVGGFVGQAQGNQLKFINCYMGADVVGNSTGNRALVGGFLGNNNNKSASFTNCVQTGTVKNLSSHANSAVGYLASNYSAAANLNNVTMTGSYAHSARISNAASKVFSNGETVVSAENAGKAASYGDLSPAVWTVQDYYYPILKTFASYAMPAGVIPVDSGETLAKIGADANYPMDGTYLLTADLDLSGKTWTPIGSAASPFTGTLLGNGHKINGLTIGTEAAPVKSASVKATDGTSGLLGYGLFGEVKGATVQDLALTGVSIFLDGTDAATEKKVGAVAGRSDNVTLKNIAVISGTISVINQDTKACQAGGLIGDAVDAASSQIVIENAFVGLTVTASSKNRAMIGGFVGNINNRPTSISDSVSAAILKNKTPAAATGAPGTGCTLANWAGSEAAIAKINERGSLSAVYTHPYLLSAGNKSVVMKHNAEIAVSMEDALDADSYDALGGAWETKDGYYPMLKTFKTLAVEVVKQVGTPLKTAEDLLKIGNDEEYPADGQYYLANDIDISHLQWTPIDSFTGVLDGNGCAVIGLTIGTEQTPKALASAGFFRALNGTVKNLIFKDVYIHTAEATYGWAHEDGVGTVAGTVSGAAVIDGVTVLNGTVKDTGSHETTLGGIVGNAVQAGWTVKNCLNAADLTGGYAHVAGAEDNRAIAGGIVGNARTKGTIENCLNLGTIRMENYGFADPIGSFYKYMGAPSAVKNCYYLSGCLDLNRYGYAYGFTDGVTFEETDTVSVTAVTKQELLDGSVDLGDGWAAESNAYPYPKAAVRFKKSVTKQTSASVRQEILSALQRNEIVVTNHTTAESLLNRLNGMIYTDGLTLSWESALEIEQSTVTQPGSAEGTLRILSDSGMETLEISETIAPVPFISYRFTGNYPGRADGTVSVTFAAADYETYALYWGNEEGILPGCAELTVFTANKKTAEYTAVRYSLIPEGATKLWLVRDGNRITAYDIPADRQLKPSREKYRFGVLSDGHISEATVGAKSAQMLNVLRAMELFKSTQASFVTLLGDNTTYNNDAQLPYWNDVQQAFPGLPLYSTLGNHDILPHNTKEDDVAKSFLRFQAVFRNTKDYNYTVEEGNDLFVYLGLGQADDLEAYNGLTLHNDQITWLAEVLKKYYVTDGKDGHVFLMFHLFPVDTAYAASASNGFNPDSSAKLEAVLKQYPGVIWFSGHNHYAFSCNKNIYATESYTMLHAPSVGVGGALGKEGHTLGGEGYLTVVYDDYVIVKGYNAYTNKIIPSASFLVSIVEEADYTGVEDAIAGAEALNQDLYKDFSAVTEAINAVIRGKKATEQADVDAMAEAIRNAIAGLEEKETGTTGSTDNSDSSETTDQPGNTDTSGTAGGQESNPGTSDLTAAVIPAVLALIALAAAIAVRRKKTGPKR